MQPPLERWDHNTREALARTLGSREEKGRSHSKPSRTRRKKKKKKSARDREQVRQVSRQFSGGSLAKEQQQSQTHHRESEEKSRY